MSRDRLKSISEIPPPPPPDPKAKLLFGSRKTLGSQRLGGYYITVPRRDTADVLPCPASLGAQVTLWDARLEASQRPLLVLTSSQGKWVEAVSLN